MRFQNLLRLSIVLIITGYLSQGFSQCLEEVNFNDWSKEGNPDAVWIVEHDSIVYISADQSSTTPPTFFVTSKNFLNVKIFGTITTQTSFDDDFIGFVFGYKKPNSSTSSSDYEFLLLDWKKESGEAFGEYAKEGFTLVKVNGHIDEAYFWQFFWGHESEPGRFEVLATKYGSNKGWEYNSSYNFELNYTSTRTIILIDGDTIFDHPGCYETGRFGFYCFSQEHGIRFESFDYKLEVDFKILNNNQCMGDIIQFSSIDEHCSVIPSNIISWKWDFGDGSFSEEINPSHQYTESGTYNVKLVVTDEHGCSDSTHRSVTIHPFPDLSSLNDTLVEFGSDLTLNAGNYGAQFLWTNGEVGRIITLEQLTEETIIGVEITKHNCSIFKEITIFVGPPPVTEIYLPNAFTPDNDGLNDLFMAKGKNIDQFIMYIYDKWGMPIYNTDDISTGWDGTKNGNPCPEGVYVYLIDYTGIYPDNQASATNISGTLTLIR